MFALACSASASINHIAYSAPWGFNAGLPYAASYAAPYPYASHLSISRRSYAPAIAPYAGFPLSYSSYSAIPNVVSSALPVAYSGIQNVVSSVAPVTSIATPVASSIVPAAVSTYAPRLAYAAPIAAPIATPVAAPIVAVPEA